MTSQTSTGWMRQCQLRGAAPDGRKADVTDAAAEAIVIATGGAGIAADAARAVVMAAVMAEEAAAAGDGRSSGHLPATSCR